MAQASWLFHIGFLTGMIILISPMAPSHATYETLYTQRGFEELSDTGLKAWVDSIEIIPPAEAPVEVSEPLPGTVYPSDLAAPAFVWNGAESDPPPVWLLCLVADGGRVKALTDRPWWVPRRGEWESIRRMSGARPVKVSVHAVGGWTLRQALATGHTNFSVSTHAVDAHLAFIRKPLPFKKAADHPEKTELRIGDLSSYREPRCVLRNQPLCFNCHAFASQGHAVGMDMDVKGDKGGYMVAPATTDMQLNKEHFISWNDLPTPSPAPFNMGFFARFSPTGRYIAATVGETSLFVMMDDVYFTQLFYPATGRIACYDRKLNRFFTLNGADLPEFVQTGPEWSPDGRSLVFSRARVDADLVAAVQAGAPKKEPPSQTIDELNAKYPFKFDLYQVPFNDGRGGEPKPLKGASDNGMSNYFPRYSPDGRWIVFTQSPTGHALQPESRLCIVPAKGGGLRVLESNTPLMNSWHSWSPNGRWLAFASKGQSPFTELYLTEISSDGTATPPVRLFRLSSPNAAAMVPEFISAPFSKIDSIRLNDRQWALQEDLTAKGR